MNLIKNLCLIILFIIPSIFFISLNTSVAEDNNVLSFKSSNKITDSLYIEIARTPLEHRIGLMGRVSMQDNQGMLFIFDPARKISMWLKNTLIPLDLIFIDISGRVVQIEENTQPMSDNLISSIYPVRAILEINSGVSKKMGISLGDFVINSFFEYNN